MRGKSFGVEFKHNSVDVSALEKGRRFISKHLM